jgi:hypothetical protein
MLLQLAYFRHGVPLDRRIAHLAVNALFEAGLSMDQVTELRAGHGVVVVRGSRCTDLDLAPVDANQDDEGRPFRVDRHGRLWRHLTTRPD